MNNNLSHILEIIRIYSKNYVSNNPTWDQEILVNNIREKAFREAEDLNIKLSEEDIAVIIELALRDLQGKMIQR